MITAMERLKLYESVVNTYGIKSQQYMLVEECGELLNALAKLIRGRASFEELNTELADVSIMVEQIAHFYGWEEFLEERGRKLERLKQRLEEHHKKENGSN